MEINRFRIGSGFSGRKYPGRYSKIDTSQFVRVKIENGPELNVSDLPEDLPGKLVRNKAWSFHYRDAVSGNITLGKKIYDYEMSLYAPWETSHMRAVISEISKGKAVISSPNINTNAVIISCRSNPLESESRNVIWDGYSKENNFLPLFKKQIDDKLDPLSGIFINPYGGLTIEYMNRKRLDRASILSGIIVAGIVYSVPTVYVSFDNYYGLYFRSLFRSGF